MDTQDIPVPNVIPRVLLDVISRLESDKLKFSWKFSRNVDGFSRVMNQVRISAKHSVPRKDIGNTFTVDVESQPRRKTWKKSPSALAHDHARHKYFQKKAALKAASLECEQLTRDCGMGETVAPKELDSLTPQRSEEPASHCIEANELKVANTVVQQRVTSKNSGTSRKCSTTLDSDDSVRWVTIQHCLTFVQTKLPKAAKDPSELQICSKCRL